MEDVKGEVTLRHNHYKHNFPTVNNTLSKLLIDEEWYLSGVYQGNF